MKVIADEGVSREVVNRLRAEGHEVEWVSESSPGSADTDILAKAAVDKAVLLTEDKDFGELVYRKKLGHSGVILLRLDGCSPEEKSEIVSNVFRQSLNEIKSAFVVIDNRSMRVRRTPFGSD